MRTEIFRILLVLCLAAGFTAGCGDPSSSSPAASHDDHGMDDDHDMDDNDHDMDDDDHDMNDDDHDMDDDDHDMNHDDGDMDDDDSDIARGDDLAQSACDGMARELTVVTAGSSVDAAENAMVMPGATTWVLKLPEGAAGYATLMVPEDHGDWGIFVDAPDVLVSLTAPDGRRFDILPKRPNEACPDEIQVDDRIHIMEKGNYLLFFSADGPREITLQILQGSAADDGEADMVSVAACESLDGEAVMIMSAATEDAAAEVAYIEASDTVYEVVVPAGTSYAYVSLGADHTDWAVFVSEPEIARDLSDGDIFYDISGESPSLACADDLKVDRRVHIHSGGLYLLKFQSEKSTTLLFRVISVTEGHGDMGGDDGDDHGDMDHGNGDDHGDMYHGNGDDHGDMGHEDGDDMGDHV